ncbi:Urease accessory protein UreD [Pseudoruegeria aquimaris]|uniref:Urease accessory protein UreD n=1 Tax=Pseudoruegeria aquimaris TaxID=393663 RepID=A0A1Y5RPX4_9RHOB|nr:urease accessory protein UreD [Pseudoruegeria aquimaris]SLN22691.1 Urease accessory protein UreD [Pseudoruegeria aquimaris]
MLDSSQIRMQRAAGRAEVAIAARGGRNALCRLHQSGSAKAFLPKVHTPVPEVVFLNTSGGVTGGDRIGYRLEVGAGAQVIATTQTAERAYQSSADVGEVTVELSVGEGGVLEWLPQETILFDHSAMTRRTTVDLAAGARFLMVETVVLGRAAMGEVIEDLAFFDLRQIRREGRPVLVEPLQIDAAALGLRDHPAVFGGAVAMSTLAYVAEEAEDVLARIGSLPESDEVAIAASAWEGRCVLRFLAGDAWPLRRALADVLNRIRGRALPRVWQM